VQPRIGARPQQQLLPASQVRVLAPQRVHQPVPAGAQIVLPGERDAVQRPRQQRRLTEVRVGAPERSPDGPHAQSAVLDLLAQVLGILDRVPRELHRHRARGPGQAVHLGRVVDPLVALRRRLDHEVAERVLQVHHGGP
jgi:hypothetical protein